MVNIHMSNELKRFLALCMVFLFFFGCLSVETQVEPVDIVNETEIAETITGTELPESIFPDINETEGEFPLPV